MRGTDETTGALFSDVDLDERVPARHPLREVREIVNDALVSMDAEFDRLYAREGRPSIAPERLLRASGSRCCSRCAPSVSSWSRCSTNLLFRVRGCA
jgi:hypothetical protein